MSRLLALLLCWPLLLGAASRSFDGTNDEIDFGDNYDVGDGSSSTTCAWVKLTEDASIDAIVVKSPDLTSTTQGYRLSQDASDVLTWNVADGTDAVTSTATTDIDGAWHFVCGVWNGSTDTTTLYVDGVQEDTDTGANVGSLANTSSCQLGEDNSDNNDLTGLVAYVQHFNTTLTAQQIIECQWHPGGCEPGTNLRGSYALWGESPEPQLGNAATTITGTVTGASTSTDGPPTMVGGYLPL